MYALYSYTDDPEAVKCLVNAAVYTLGELGMLGFSLEEEEPAAAQALKQHSLSLAHKKDRSLPTYTISERSHTFKLNLPETIITTVQLLMGYKLPLSPRGLASGSHADHQIDKVASSIPSEIRAFSFITIGKLCLRNKTLAQKLINVFLRELSLPTAISSTTLNTTTTIHDAGDVYNTTTTNTTYDSTYNTYTATVSSTDDDQVAVRSNALLILGDFCIRYTNMVDRHVGALAKCLQDTHVIVRKHAIILLTQLLLQDYLKWRGMLLFRFLATATDSDSDTAEFAKLILKKTILSKYPDFFG